MGSEMCIRDRVMTVLVAAEQAEKNAIAAAENENTEIDRQAVIENKLNEVVTITREATDYSYVHDCSTTGFLDGEQVPLRDVFNGTILPSGGESAYQLAVYTAGSMEAFVDMMNQKAVELGAYSVVPVSTRRCVVKLDNKKAEKKVSRWQQIAESAAKQSKRMLVPEVHSVMTFKEALVYAKELDVLLIPYELSLIHI